MQSRCARSQPPHYGKLGVCGTVVTCGLLRLLPRARQRLSRVHGAERCSAYGAARYGEAKRDSAGVVLGWCRGWGGCTRACANRQAAASRWRSWQCVSWQCVPSSLEETGSRAPTGGCGRSPRSAVLVRASMDSRGPDAFCQPTRCRGEAAEGYNISMDGDGRPHFETLAQSGLK